MPKGLSVCSIGLFLFSIAHCYLLAGSPNTPSGWSESFIAQHLSGSKGQHQPLNAACPERPLHSQDRSPDCVDRRASKRRTASACPDRLVSTQSGNWDIRGTLGDPRQLQLRHAALLGAFENWHRIFEVISSAWAEICSPYLACRSQSRRAGADLGCMRQRESPAISLSPRSV